MKYSLIDYQAEEYQDVTVGTCELCFYTVDFETHTFVIRDEQTGEVHHIKGYDLDWDNINIIELDNIPHFAGWFNAQDFDEEIYEDYPSFWLFKHCKNYLKEHKDQ